MLRTEAFKSHTAPPPGPGVCYHCRAEIWDGKGQTWDAPPFCPHCRQPLILAWEPRGRGEDRQEK